MNTLVLPADTLLPQSTRAISQLGQPRPGLGVLCLVEFLERLSFYGVRAILVLFMVAPVLSGGLGLRDAQAAAIYGLYVGGAYLTALLGGWLADSWLGPARAVKIGVWLTAIGHGCLAVGTGFMSRGDHVIPSLCMLALALIALGTGFFKPNISALVGSLYAHADSRRDAGFSLFYMIVNGGALAGGLLCGWVALRLGWGAGFAAASIGILMCGSTLLVSSLRRVPVFSADSLGLAPPLGVIKRLLWIGVVVLCLGFIVSGIEVSSVARVGTLAVAALAVGYFAWLLTPGRLSLGDKSRVVSVLVLVATGTVFIFGFEQSGSWLTLFAERMTRRTAFNIVIPAAWYSTVNAICVLLFAPLLALIWRVQSAGTRVGLTTSAKLSAGLALVAAGFVLIAYASVVAQTVGQVAPWWLLGTYILHTLGELFISPVSLSAITRLAPRALAGQLLGAWYMSAALGSVASGVISDVLPIGSAPLFGRFIMTAAVLGIGSITLFLSARRLRSIGL